MRIKSVRSTLNRLAIGIIILSTIPACKPRRESEPTSEVKADTMFGNSPVDLTTYRNSSINRRTLESEMRLAGADSTEAFKKAEQKYRQLGISLEEAAAIYAYTDSGFKDLNDSLRSESADTLIVKYGTFIKAIASGINNLPAFRCKAYRFVNFDQQTLDQFAVNAKHIEKAFVSTSATPSPKGTYFNNMNHAIILDSDQCRSIEYVSKYGANEKEVLFPPGSEFRVTSTWRQYQYTLNGRAKNLWTITLNHLEPGTQTVNQQQNVQQAANQETGGTTFSDFIDRKFIHSQGESWEFRNNYLVNYTQGGRLYNGRWEHDGEQHIKVTWSNNQVQWIRIFSGRKIASISGNKGSNQVSRYYELPEAAIGQPSQQQGNNGSWPKWMQGAIRNSSTQRITMLQVLIEASMGRLDRKFSGICYKPSSGGSPVYCKAKNQSDVNFLRAIDGISSWSTINEPHPSQFLDD